MILTRNIDLSVGSIVGVTAYVTGEYLHDHPELAPVLAVAYAVAIGGGLGLLNGVLVAYARVPSIIVTLGTLAIFRTLADQPLGLADDHLRRAARLGARPPQLDGGQLRRRGTSAPSSSAPWC